jgi:glycosyltransferase involved in cell wall biosynthesis
VYRAANYLEELVDALRTVRDEWNRLDAPILLLEAIFIADSPVDNSCKMLESIRHTNDWVHVITLSKNFGQHPATVAGILHSSGDWLFTIDEDMQHNPNHFLELLRHAVIRELDIVYVKSTEPVHESVFRDRSSRFVKGMMARITGNAHIKDFNSFRLVRGQVARAAASICSHATYFDVALCWFSNKIDTYPLSLKDHRYIATKKSGYNLIRLVAHFRRLIITSPFMVLRASSAIGFSATLLSFIFGGFFVVRRFFDPVLAHYRGWTSIFVTILFFGGLTTFLLGLLVEYVANILLHSHGKPTFFIVNRSMDGELRKFFAGSSSGALPIKERAVQEPAGAL